MDALSSPVPQGWRRERAWGALRALLEAYPEGVAGIAALDRLVEYGLREADAALFLEQLREDGVLVTRHGRWRLR